jgi:hypothetical protein
METKFLIRHWMSRVRASSLQALFKDQFSVAIDYLSLGYRKLSLALTAWSDTVQCQFDADRDLIIYPAGIPLPSPDAPSNPVSSSRNPKSSKPTRSDFKRTFPDRAPVHMIGNSHGWVGGAPPMMASGLYADSGWYGNAPWNGGMQNSWGGGPRDWQGGGYQPGRQDLTQRRLKPDPARYIRSHFFA